MKLFNLLLIKVALISAVTAAPASYSNDRCGNGYGVCSEGYCCSQYGYCGKSEDYCGKGCQSEYGICNIKTTTSTKKSTTTTKKSTTTTKKSTTTTTKKTTTSTKKSTTTTKKSTTTTTKKQSTSTSISTYGPGKIEWAGFRFSLGEITESFGYVPSGSQWVELMNKWKSNFNSNAKPAVIVIVSQNQGYNDDDSKPRVNGFNFPKPTNVKDYKYIDYSEDNKDHYEDILNKYDSMGYNVWLQVEPGNNDLITLADITFKQYGHHTCVKGFGIDLEWWYAEDYEDGKGLSDDEAKKIVKYIRSINPEYTVFAKHWLIEKMPPKYRDGMIFINDSQDMPFDELKEEFREWAQHFPNNPIMYQIGYDADRNQWKKEPIKFAKDVINEVTKYHNHVGIFWYDGTLNEAIKKM